MGRSHSPSSSPHPPHSTPQQEQHVAPVIVDYWERAEFPFPLVPKLAALNLGGGTLTGHGCCGHSLLGAAMVVIEMARVDASMSTFLMVHNSLAMLTIGLLGSEAQKAELLPSMARLDTVGSWALTEPGYGSDASSLASTATRVEGGWKLNGHKRWIGNATWCDVIVVWARNTETNAVNAFIVRKGTPGLTTSKIENKIALRCVQNADITLRDVFVPDSARLPGVSSFQDTNKVLAISRVMVAWQPVGIAMGVYDMCVRYVKERSQFGAPLAAFQATQEKAGPHAGQHPGHGPAGMAPVQAARRRPHDARARVPRQSVDHAARARSVRPGPRTVGRQRCRRRLFGGQSVCRHGGHLHV